MSVRCILSIDQGTTSTRAFLFSDTGQILAKEQFELTQFYPADGYVEHDANEILEKTLLACRSVLAEAETKGYEVLGVGITNQRETVVIWDRSSGKPIHRAIVWQDRRTHDTCAHLRKAGHETTVTATTGLLLDPYFSATKIAWILDNVTGARSAANAGKLAFGTTDSWLVWHLTGGAVHATDATNASRTALFDIHAQQWSAEMLQLFDVPAALLPEVRDSADDYGMTDKESIGRALPIAGIAGDQHAATFGQACFQPGMLKITYGTGAFMVLNTGDQAQASSHRLLTTVAWRIGGKPTYALEGVAFNAGTVVQWLRDKLAIIGDAHETEALCALRDSSRGVHFVPAFTGLGAPWWDPQARAQISGLTRDSDRADIVRAGLESVVYQTADLIAAMRSDTGLELAALRVDGGMVVNNWLCQTLADMLDSQVERPLINETTAQGAAMLAALQLGIYPSLDDLAAHWQCERQFIPQLEPELREQRLSAWAEAVARTRSEFH
ncbi:glycerol kinase GlpK [Gammaproteobacteria bacterium]|nr:glycerol kinase GlpK [Gammaproteobacteria bacterium]